MKSVNAQVESFSSLDDKKKKECGLLSNLYSIVIVVKGKRVIRRRWTRSNLRITRATFLTPS